MSTETADAPVEQSATTSAAQLAAEVERLRAKNTELLTEKKALKESRTAEQSELDRLRKLEQDREEAKLLEQGNFTEAKTKLQTQFDDAQKAWAAEREQLKAKIRDLELISPASRALAAVCHDPDDVFKTGRLTVDQIESTPDGPVVVNGLERTPIDAWAKANLPQHYLKAPKPSGSGAPASRSVSVDPGERNPFSRDYFNLTEQARLFDTDPARYQALKAAAAM